MKPLPSAAFTLFALSAAALPPINPPGDHMSFEEVGIMETGFQDASGTQAATAGIHDAATGAVVDPGAEKGGVAGCFMHPPYRKGAGTVWQSFPVALPQTPATLRGLTALREGAEKSDGVTHQVWVDDKLAWSEHRKSMEWTPFSVDLAPWAGKTVTIRFEITPGPSNDTSFDWAMWGARELVLPGRRNEDSRPAPIPLPLAGLSSRPDKSWAPLSGFSGANRVAVEAGNVLFSYEGPDGTLTYRWPAGLGSGLAPLLTARMAGDRSVDVALAATTPIHYIGGITVDKMEWKMDGARSLYRLPLSGPDGAHGVLAIAIRMEGKSLVVEAECDQPWIMDYTAGGWGPVAFRKTVPMPYASHPVEFLPAENLFVTAFPDWEASNASRFERGRAVYAPLTDGTRNRLRERNVFTAAWHVDEVLPNIPNPPSPHRADMAGRMVFDLWFGLPFAETAKRLDALATLGIRDDFILLHNWQRDGYDNGLPAHWPASAKLGGESAMELLSAAARRHGHLFALHENYVDYYPNYEHFNRADISTRSDGRPEEAWYNSGTKIQSFAVKPSAMVRLARGQSPEIHKRYGTTASFVDVKSCVPPWFHVDFEPGLPGAGTLQSVIAAHRALWAHGRETHGGPMTGEGNLHWFWSGWLDGVEAQFGTGWGHNAGRSAPLLVDFDLLRIHPLQLNHGQGYFDRWLEKDRPWGAGMPVIAHDQYRMQEAVFGHAGFVGGLDPGPAWLEQNLMVPLTRLHALAKVTDIRYHLRGEWVDTTAAVKATLMQGGFGGRLQRVRVAYDNGLVVTANGEEADFEVDGTVLPQFGWLARAPDFEAGTVRKDGVVVDFLSAPDRRFANARRLRDWKTADATLPVRVALKNFESVGGGRIRFAYEWRTDTAIPEEHMCFVHVDRPGGDADHPVFLIQQDHALPRPVTAWRPGDVIPDGPYDATVPPGTPDGRHPWYIGLWNQQGRLPLEGRDDGRRRILLGHLVVADGGKSLRFEPAAEPAAGRANWFTRNLNVAEKSVDFGFLETSGSVLLTRGEGGEWKKISFPAAADFELELRADMK